MIPAIEGGELEGFRGAIAGRLGLHFDEARSAFLAELLRRRSEAAGLDAAEYLSRLENRRWPEELGCLAEELTVPETYFFRSIDQLRAFEEVVLPERLAKSPHTPHLSIMSLGCASGEEAYSLAMVVRDRLADAGRHVSITGVDVNPAVIDKARRARFSPWALRETPERARKRWFRPDGRNFVLDDSIRGSVRFEQRNLAEDDLEFWRPGAYDVIFCRNVVMYFTPEQATRVIERIARALRPAGYLFLGHAETLRGLSNDFHLRHTHGTFYYQRREHVGSAPAMPRLAAGSRPLPTAALVESAAEADTWVEAIHRASERVAALTEPRGSKPTAGRAHSPAAADSGWDLGLVLELLRKERFIEALAMIDTLPPTSHRDPDVLLLRAVLLAHAGQFAGADETCRRLLEVDELSAGAHYVLALCREGAGDRAGAAHHDQVSAYLDPGFAMPRLHLGLLARRAGQRAAARRDLGHALVLLQREDASRVLLFGGGFGREALVTLCGAELSRCEGAREW